MGAESIKDMPLERIEEVMAGLGEPMFRARQVYDWIHTRNAGSYEEMTNLPKSLRERLQEAYPISESRVIEVAVADDGTRKYLLELSDGRIVEMVGILDRDVEDADDASAPEGARLTVCCSSQVGCGMGCTFCATGKQGISRSLIADEIVDQVYKVGSDMGIRVSNVVIMGQGEPFQNYDETIAALRRINADKGLGIGARHITVSTAGLVDGIRRFAEEPEQFRLAISLHSAVQETRDLLMPGLRKLPLEALKKAVSDYCEAKGRRVTLEYMLLDGINDTDEELSALIGFCEGLNVHVNLLPFNEVEGVPYEPSSAKTARKWGEKLSDAGIPNSIRRSKGSDVAGACGQLKAKSAKLRR